MSDKTGREALRAQFIRNEALTRIRAAVRADFSPDHDYTVGEVAQDRRFLLVELDNANRQVAALQAALHRQIATPSPDPEPTPPLDIVTALLGEVGFMRSCIASGEKLNQDDLDRQNAVMRRATKYAATLAAKASS